jgi:CRP-like cAMP-binding protein
MMRPQPKPPAVFRVPAFRGTSFFKSSPDTRTAVLTDRQREELARISTRLRLPPRTRIYEEGGPAQSIFLVAEGIVKSYRELRSGRRVVANFLFERDLFGLAENGRYVNATQAITRALVYRLPVDELTVLLRHDPDMQFEFLMKVTHELREAQRRAILINRRDAPGRLAMFLALMLDQQQQRDPEAPPRECALPMSRADIAAFLGLSAESVSRASAALEKRGLVKFVGRRSARILDPDGLAKIAAEV